MPVRKTVRIYDLAKELKQDTKRVMEELRRAGADVSVASNSVPIEFAEKLRNKYISKAEAPAKPRAIKVIKAAKKEESAVADEPTVGVEAEVAEPTAAPVEAEPTPVEAPEPAPEPKRTTKVLKPKAVPVAEPAPAPIEAETEQPEPAKEPEPAAPIETPAPEAVAPTPKTTATTPTRPAGTSIKILKPTSVAVEKGIKAGDASIVSKGPAKTGTLSGGDRGRPQFQGTPGERTAPQMTYTPPADNRRRPGRSGGRKGRDDKGSRFAEREIDVPRQTTIEERVMQQVAKGDSQLKTVRLTEGATIREFAEALGITPRDIVQLLIKRGVFATLNQPIGEKMAIEMGKDFGFDVSFVPFEEMVIEQEFEELIAADADDVELPRAPVVTVMGHVDHGKTSLLDAIRQENVAEGEAGGITQHIGAYSVFVPNPDDQDQPRRVVFLDTPGHEAFTMMRARGAKATDIVILVVAADDGVMPQTIEAVEHSKAAGVPIIVAINKIDKPDANPDKVKQGLANLGLQPVDWGGDIEMVPVSAKKKEGLDALLETVLLQADILDLKASPTRRASGVVLEAKLDRGRGAVATALVQQGTLRVGDPFIVGQFYGKVRAMFSDRGEQANEAAPSTPVEILGLQGVPQAGDTFQVVGDVERAQDIANQRQMLARQAAMVKTTKRGIESLGQAEVKELLVILKADVQGSVEVLRATLEKLSTDKVKVKVIRAGVGAIAESDVLLASATQADNLSTAVVIIGFNVRPEARASEVAKHEDVDIRLHSIIYKVEEEIKAAMIGMLDAIEKEVILGKARVQEIFKVSRIGTIAGCRVTDGVIRRQAKARLIRDGVVIWEGDISSLKRFKEDASEVRQGFECGISLVNFNDIKVEDEIEAFVIEKIAATEL
jgi:translation initiation factor IF-2